MAPKRQKLSSETPGGERSDDEEVSEVAGDDQSQHEVDSENAISDDDGHSSADTDDIADGKRPKSKKTLKRKRRATEPSRFGATLQSLLDTSAPSSLPLSLKPSIARKRNDQKVELKAKKILHIEKKDKEDQGRIKDIIGGWGAESERSLRKVAQRGVVKLFNTIQQAQAAAAANEGAKKPSHLLSSSKKGGKNKEKPKDGATGKDAAVGQEDFYKLIRSGGLVSRT